MSQLLSYDREHVWRRLVGEWLAAPGEADRGVQEIAKFLTFQDHPC
jgi:hypothetical protein